MTSRNWGQRTEPPGEIHRYTREYNSKRSKNLQLSPHNLKTGRQLAQRGEPLLPLETESASPVHGNHAFSNS